MTDYDQIARDTHEDIRENGASFTLEQVVTSDYDTESSAVESGARAFKGFAVRHDNVLREISGEIIEGDIGLLASVFTETMDPMPQPKIGSRVLFDGSWWRIVTCTPLKPATVAVLYQVQARK